jgi:hypothetical protein
MSVSSRDRFLTYSFSRAVFKKKIVFVYSACQGDFSFICVITGYGILNSTITLPRFKIRISDLGNLNYDKALAKQTKEYLLIRYTHFCNAPTKRNANILVFSSELLPSGANLFGHVGGATRYLTIVGRVGVQMKYLFLDFITCLPQVITLARD